MTEFVPAAEIKVSGAPLDPELAAQVQEVRVKDDLVHPDTFTIKIADPGLEKIDDETFSIGKEVEISFRGAGRPSDSRRPQLKSLIKGDVIALEPEFNESGAFIVVRGYDKSHKLNRTKNTKTYQNQTYGDIARAVIGAAGMTPGTIDDDGGTQDFVQQSTETDWDFLWRLAERIGNEVVAEENKVHFRRAGGTNGGAKELTWGSELQSFQPRVTGVQQVNEVTVRGWDPKTKQAITATKTAQPTSSTIGIQRSQVSSELSGGTVTIGDRLLTSVGEANALAQSVVDGLANSYLDATGTALGDPELRAGSKVQIKGVGTKFGGTYTLSSTTHVYGKRGYVTKFTISGRASSSVVDLMTPKESRNWASSVVVGIVTNNNDPDNLGRVRVKYPSLGDETEGWWARIASTAAGKDRGVLMMPQPNDEVLIAFENNDTRRPYILGSVWNARDTPNDLVQKDGSYALQSDKKMIVKAKEDIDFKGSKKVKVDSTGDFEQKSSANVKLEASQGVTVKAGTSIDVKGTTITVEANGNVTIKGSLITVQASGMLTLKGSQVMLG